MTGLLEAIQSVDASVYRVLNGYAGNSILDHFAAFEEGTNALKGGLFMALYWALWFGHGGDREKRRRAVIVVLAGALLALIAARALADLAPYRLRPMYDPRVAHRSYSFGVTETLIDWSAFPSDHATFFFALAFGLVYVSRRLAIPAMLYVLGWIALPRMYLGIHWTSDIVVGCAIGAGIVWAAFRAEGLRSVVAARVVASAETSPSIFYGAAFLASFEMGVLFEDVRTAARGLFRMLHLALPEILAHGKLVTFGALGFISVAIVLTILGCRRTTVRIRWRPAVTR